MFISEITSILPSSGTLSPGDGRKGQPLSYLSLKQYEELTYLLIRFLEAKNGIKTENKFI